MDARACVLRSTLTASGEATPREGTKTVIPSKASAKISMRLVPNQDFRKIGRLFEKHFKAIAPKSVKVKVSFLHGGMPYVAPTDMPATRQPKKPFSTPSASGLCPSIRAARYPSSAPSSRRSVSSRCS